MEYILKSKKVLNRCLEIIVGACFIVMFLSITLQIIARNFLQIPFVWTEELSRSLYVWITFLGAVVITADDEHIKVEIISTALPKKVQKAIIFIGNILAMVFCAASFKGGAMLVGMNLTAYMSTLPHFITFAYLYAVVPISMGLIFVILAFRVIAMAYEVLSGKSLVKSVYNEQS